MIKFTVSNLQDLQNDPVIIVSTNNIFMICYKRKNIKRFSWETVSCSSIFRRLTSFSRLTFSFYLGIALEIGPGFLIYINNQIIIQNS